MNRKRILIVDDNPVILRALSYKLGSCGYEVVTALDGSQALGVVREGKPDLILLDVSFPPDVPHGGMVAWDGFLLMEWLRRSEPTRDIPVIIITGGDPSVYKERALAAGALSFFHKPLDSSELIAMVQRTLGTEVRTETTPAVL